MCHIQRWLFNRLRIWRTFYDGGNDGGGRTAFVGPPKPLLKDHFPTVFSQFQFLSYMTKSLKRSYRCQILVKMMPDPRTNICFSKYI